MTNTATKQAYSADVVQFLRPDGRQKQVTTELPAETQAVYDNMVNRGFRLEAEVLATGEVSVTIARQGLDVDIRVTPNGPEVPEALAAMLKRGLWNVVGVCEGDLCLRGACNGVIEKPVENCSCHLSPPCSQCTDAKGHCPECDWEESEEEE